MADNETEILLREALAAASDGPEEIEDWLVAEGLDPEGFGHFLVFMVERYPNPLETMTQIGKGFHIGWEARKLMEAKDR